MRKLMACLVALAATTAANATVILSDSAGQSTTGQNFAFVFNAVPQSNGTDGTFTITARGDYTLGFPGLENAAFDIDGLAAGVGAPDTGIVINSFSFDDTEWSQTFTISGALLAAITADGMVTITIDLPGDVNAFDPNTAYVAVNLQFEEVTPEPISCLVFGGLLTGGGWLVRRRMKANVA